MLMQPADQAASITALISYCTLPADLAAALQSDLSAPPEPPQPEPVPTAISSPTATRSPKRPSNSAKPPDPPTPPPPVVRRPVPAQAPQLVTPLDLPLQTTALALDPLPVSGARTKTALRALAAALAPTAIFAGLVAKSPLASGAVYFLLLFFCYMGWAPQLTLLLLLGCCVCGSAAHSTLANPSAKELRRLQQVCAPPHPLCPSPVPGPRYPNPFVLATASCRGATGPGPCM